MPCECKTKPTRPQHDNMQNEPNSGAREAFPSRCETNPIPGSPAARTRPSRVWAITKRTQSPHQPRSISRDIRSQVVPGPSNRGQRRPGIAKRTQSQRRGRAHPSRALRAVIKRTQTRSGCPPFSTNFRSQAVPDTTEVRSLRNEPKRRDSAPRATDAVRGLRNELNYTESTSAMRTLTKRNQSPHPPPPTNSRNVRAIRPASSSSGSFFLVRRSCPAPSHSTSAVRAGISETAARNSSLVPNWSRVPCTNKAGVRSDGKCFVRGSSGRRGGCKGYESSNSASATSGCSAASIEACRPPYEWPPRNTRPVLLRRACAACSRRAARSFDASVGPDRRCSRNHRSTRTTRMPPAVSARSSATSNGDSRFEPAPWVRTIVSISITFQRAGPIVQIKYIRRADENVNKRGLSACTQRISPVLECISKWRDA